MQVLLGYAAQALKRVVWREGSRCDAILKAASEPRLRRHPRIVERARALVGFLEIFVALQHPIFLCICEQCPPVIWWPCVHDGVVRGK